MGADGHIQVYDWEKVIEKFPDAGEKLISSLGYVQTMKTPDGKSFTVFSGYYGDNLIYSWCDVGELIAYNSSEEYKERVYEIIRWMNENALLFQWEVWT
jgi:hypothetical protein